MYRLVIFDFDGTLVDTITDVGVCFNQALKENNLPEHPLSAYSGFVGGNLETVVSRMLPSDAITAGNITKVRDSYRKRYSESPKPNTRPYPGVYAMLCNLKEQGFYIAINSNKGQGLLDQLVEKFFPPHFFDVVIGYEESRPSKPSPYGVELICETCGCLKTQAVYVGDGKSDIDTAFSAGIPCIFVEWGQGTAEDRIDSRVFERVTDCQQLTQIILREKQSSNNEE